ncbi:hypothetical protein FF2_029195 [Malus domestica]
MVSALKMNTVFAYTVVYVKDVALSTAFYSKAFGYNIRRLDGYNRCKNKGGGEWGGAGEPAGREKVGYVRDLDGIVVRLGSYVNPPKKQ